MVARRSVAERFWEKVDKSEGPDGCWLWKATTLQGKFPYGRFVCREMSRQCPNQLAHRVSWVITNGPIPDGMCVLHRCDNPRCVNTSHLFLGTYADNHADCKRKGRNRKACGDANGSRRHPERLARGERSWTRMYPERVLRGEHNGNRKLTEQAVRSVRLRRDGGQSFGSIASSFGVSKKTIMNIVNRCSWRHVK